jgi:hypothetical protein
MLTCRGLPWDGPDAIEAKQAEFGSEPEVAVGRLSNCVDDSLKPVPFRKMGFSAVCSARVTH